jgi:hypothetical protein
VSLTHGLSHKHPLYERWCGMRARCNCESHTSYSRYGGRGIRVCSRWESFVVFLQDVGATWPGPGYDLHRVDNDGDYEPGNCVWLAIAEHRGLPKSAEHRAKIGAAHRGRKHSRAHTDAVAAARRAQLDPAWLRAKRRAGLSVVAIAAEAGCGKSSVHRALKRLEIDRDVDWDDEQLAKTMADVLLEDEG